MLSANLGAIHLDAYPNVVDSTVCELEVFLLDNFVFS